MLHSESWLDIVGDKELCLLTRGVAEAGRDGERKREREREL